MKKVLLLIALFSFSCFKLSKAQQGKDGVKITSASSVIVNEYTSLTTDATAGNTSIKVPNSLLNTNYRFAAPLGQGDLVMIIQMQGASIKGNVNDSTWGEITNYNNCGLYELDEVAAVPDASTITFNCPLKNNYTSSGRVEVVRVPRFSSLTVNPGDSLTCDIWNGITGGIVVAEVSGNTIINTGGFISADDKGFRGGVITNISGTQHLTDFYALTGSKGGQKGEGIAGFQNDYNNYGGGYCRGAGANGGGGGTGNASGGGGANAGNINAWTGNGNPDTSNHSWIAAWNLEYSGFANATSSGGGKGGRTASLNDKDALTVPPGNPSWGYDYSAIIGGKGGRPLDYSTGRIFMGGGGGAGGANNNVGGSGAAGGGIVYIISSGTVSGGGTIEANGHNGYNAVQGGAQDGPGGAGGGGTIIINASGSISNVQITANGGKGGDQTAAASEAEGGGGGGGGGYIAVSNGTPSCQALGGANGITHSPSFSEFPPDGGTAGGNGLPNELFVNGNNTSFSLSAGPDITICNGNAVTLHGSGGNPTSYSWSPSTGLSNNSIANPVANPTATTTYILTSSGSACSQAGQDTVVVTVNVIPTLAFLRDTAVCEGESVTLNPGGFLPTNYAWSPTVGLSCTTCASPTVTPTASTTYTVIAGIGSCADTGHVAINFGGKSHAGIVSALRDTLCEGTPGHLSLSGNSNNQIQWQSSLTSSGFTDNGVNDSIHYRTPPLLQTTYYRVIVGSGICVDTSPFIRLFVPPPLTARFSYTSSGNTVQFTDNSQGNIISYYWSFGDGETRNGPDPGHTYPKDTVYNVCLTIYDGSNCSYTFCRDVDVMVNGVSTISATGLWNIYPLPFNNELIIDGEALNSYIKGIEIFDVLGKQVISEEFKNHSLNIERIDVSTLTEGMYIIRIKSDQNYYVQKIIKE